jgi:hypothetical protein
MKTSILDCKIRITNEEGIVKLDAIRQITKFKLQSSITIAKN